MSKLKLIADPTFKASVDIPVAGGKAVPVEFTFKHRTKTQLDEFIKSRAGSEDADSLMAMAAAWELEEEFTRDNVNLLLENYVGTALAVYLVYVEQLVQAPVTMRKNK